MYTSDDDNKSSTEQLTTSLHREDKLPEKWLPTGTQAVRVQETGYPTGHFFHCPKEARRLGRFNDPQMEFGVWYGAQHPAAALAEIFGREKTPDQRAMGIVLAQEDLEGYDMCLVKTSRDLRLLDLSACLSKLRRTVDEITGPDYALTQEIMRVVCRLGAPVFDGIAYTSRHHPEGDCYALWMPPDGSPTVETSVMTAFPEFEWYDETRKQAMDVEEILTEILGYGVI